MFPDDPARNHESLNDLTMTQAHYIAADLEKRVKEIARLRPLIPEPDEPLGESIRVALYLAHDIGVKVVTIPRNRLSGYYPAMSAGIRIAKVCAEEMENCRDGAPINYENIVETLGLAEAELREAISKLRAFPRTLPDMGTVQFESDG